MAYPLTLSGTEMTVVAIVLTVAGFLLILGGVLFAWILRRQQDVVESPSSFYHFLTHRSRGSDDAFSIESWHDGSEDGPEATNLWQHPAPTKPEGLYTTEPNLDYIPYNGPVEPPRLPLPMALRALVNRPLPPLPGESRTMEPEPVSDFMGALLVRLESKKARKTMTIPRPSPVTIERVPSPALATVRGESMLSQASMDTVDSLLHGRSSATTAITSKAYNARRSAAKVLLYEADGLSRTSSLRPTSRSATNLTSSRMASPPPLPTMPAHKVKRTSTNVSIRNNPSPYYHLNGSTDSLNSILVAYPAPPDAGPCSHDSPSLSSSCPQTMTLVRALSATVPANATDIPRTSLPKNVLSGLPQRRSDPMPIPQGPTPLAPPRGPIPPSSFHAYAMPAMPAPVHRSNTTKTMRLDYDDDPRVDPFADPGATNVRSPTR